MANERIQVGNVNREMTDEEQAALDAQRTSNEQAQQQAKENNPLRFEHNSKYFVATDSAISRAAGLAGAISFLGADVTGQGFKDEDGVRYNFVDNDDFATWYASGLNAVNEAAGTAP